MYYPVNLANNMHVIANIMMCKFKILIILVMNNIVQIAGNKIIYNNNFMSLRN